MNTPMGAQNAKLTLHSEDGALTGRMTSPQGEADVQDGVVDGNSLSWKADITTPISMTLEFSATLDGDSISGNVKLGAFGTASFSGTRAG